MNKAILISIKPKWCADIMNGDKTIEVRKNKALASAIQKLINEYGYAEIYVYCSKRNPIGKFGDGLYHEITKESHWSNGCSWNLPKIYLNGKVLFKFRCYKVEEIDKIQDDYVIKENEQSSIHYECWLHKTCLLINELNTYLNGNVGYAINISDLEIFKPRELGEFYTTSLDKDIIKLFDNSIQLENGTWVKSLTKAPQNFAYIEIGE